MYVAGYPNPEPQLSHPPHQGSHSARSQRTDLTIARGEPSPAEVAAVVAVLAAAARLAALPAAPAPRSEWPAVSRQLRPPVHARAGGWRASALPR
ncbi:MAG: acyl-CoA carboxylase epsilon subunit [Streptosporangiaceae bacterium]|jgi:hypothetical protein